MIDNKTRKQDGPLIILKFTKQKGDYNEHERERERVIKGWQASILACILAIFACLTLASVPAFADNGDASLSSSAGTIKLNEPNSEEFTGNEGGNTRYWMFEMPSSGKVSISQEIKADGLAIDTSTKIEFQTYNQSTNKTVVDASLDPSSYVNKSVSLSSGWHTLKITFKPENAATKYNFTINVTYVADPYAPTYRLYNPYSGEHFFTNDTEEHEYLVSLGWKKEGEAWNSPKTSNTEVYRLYNPFSGVHFYTSDKGECEYLASLGWNKEGTAWYSDDSKGKPVYRLFNPYVTIGTHHYTTDKSEYEYLKSVGWIQEGEAWYGL